ncbi:MAG: hypothetical protein KIT57_17150 [Blastocatellales bacterium]|nr:hypothetical protein [Blastocatellales bacterium]
MERRRGRKIKGVGCYRDPVASSRKNVVKCFGLKWLSMMVCVRLPWTKRVWASPFLTVLCRAEQEGQKQKVWHTHRRRKRRPNKQRQAEAKRQAAALRALPKSTPRQHKTSVDILMILGKLLHRWLPERLIVLTVDGGYAAVKLALRCAGIPNLSWSRACAGRRRSIIRPHHNPRANPAPNRSKVCGNVRLKFGLLAPTRLGKRQKSPGTQGRAKQCCCSRALPCGTPRGKSRSRFATSSPVTQKVNCAMKSSPPPSSMPRPNKSSSGWFAAGRSR